MSTSARHVPTGPTGGLQPEAWTVLRLMRWSGEYLEAKGVERGRLDAEHLLAQALDVERLQLYLQYDRPLLPEELDRYRPLLRRRAGREPLQYILASAAFRELDLHVDGRVLIPRPETEVLVDEILAWAGGQDNAALSAMDLGTGSGAIALSLATEGPFDRIVATDVSGEALEVARANADKAGLGGSVEFREGSLFEPLRAGEVFNVVVSNPPYVTEVDGRSLQPEVRDWEPKSALLGGPDGLDVIRGIIVGAAEHLLPGGLLALEVGLGQAGPVVALLESAGGYDDARIRRDYTGRERMVLARRAGDA